MRVLITSLSALGHVHPMVPLALALQEAGHAVRWLTGPDASDRLERVGIEAIALGPAFEPLRAEYRRRYPDAARLPPRAVPDHVFPHLFGEIAPPAMLPAAIGVVEAWRPDVVVNEAGDLAAPIAAAHGGVPSVTHGFGLLTPRHRVEAASALVAPLWRSVGLDPRPYAGLYDSLYLDIYPPSLRSGDSAHVPHAVSMRAVAFDDAGDPPPDPWLDAPEGSDPLVYLTFGTVARDHSALRVALDGIAARHVRVLVTVGASGDPADLGPQPDHVRVERYVPQTHVLPRCAAVVSHAGSGTFLATLANGVPQVCLPQHADQFLNADACQASGTGIALDPDRASAIAVGEALDCILADPAFAARAREVAAEIADMPAPSAVVAAIEAVAERASSA